jgi:hypothetical protein
MSQRIHVQDDLFFLAISLKTIQDGFNLDLDSDLFMDKIAEDIGFLHASNEQIYRFLLDNPRLIARKEYLNGLLQNVMGFSEFMAGVLGKDYSLSAAFEPYWPKFQAYWDREREMISQIQEILSVHLNSDSSQTDIVSHDELSGLLEPNAEEDGNNEEGR